LKRSSPTSPSAIRLINLKGKISADIRQSYTGGSTDMFIPKSYKGKKIYAYDVNSLYPSVKANKDYPVGCSFGARDFYRVASRFGLRN
jgi:hypothetical protein